MRRVAVVATAMLFGVVTLPLDSPVSGQIIGRASLNVERAGHSATRLRDGRILIAGGENAGGALSTAELYDPTTQRFSLTGHLAFPRTDHTATLLSDGRVLLAGGRQGAAQRGHGNAGSTTVLTSTELFDPSTGVFSAGPSLASARSGHTATVLSDGHILIAGGDAQGSAETFDPATFGFTAVSAPLTTPRSLAGTALLQDGTVLIVGGADAAGTALRAAEIFTPGTSSFAALASALHVPREHPLLRVLPDGKVLIIGGNDDSTFELFDPMVPIIRASAGVLNGSNTLSNILHSRTRTALIHLLHPNNPLLGSQLTPALRALLERTGHSLTEIPDANQALVVGGVDRRGRFLRSADIVGSAAATVTTDQSDYPPGSTVEVSGTRWQAGETVLITLHEGPRPPQPGNPADPDPVYSSVADAQGSFVNRQFLTDASHLGQTFTVTAVGQSSGFVAQTAFTDAANATWTITPTAVHTSSPATFVLALTGNTGAAYPTNHANNACSAAVTVTGFASLGNVAISATHGQQWVLRSLSGSTLTLNALNCSRGPTPDDQLYKGDSLTISLSATAPATAGTQTWTAKVYTDPGLSQGAGNLTNQNITVVSSSPTTYTAAVSPTVVTAATTRSYTVTLTNTTASGGAQAGQIQIAMPPGFSAPSSLAASTSGNTCGQTNGTPWVGAGGGNAPFVNGLITLKAPGGATLCPNGGTLTVMFTATAPPASGTATWATAMRQGGTVFLLDGSQPTTTVPAGHTTMTTVTLSPTSVALGQSSAAVVTVTDTNAGSQSNPTGPVSFTSSDTGARGDTFTPPSSCTLTPSGTNAATCAVTVTPHEIGTSPHAITATYQGGGAHAPSSGSASFTVTAGAATTLVFTTQPGSAPAGNPLPGPPTVAVQDGFGNTVTDSTASITMAIGTNPGGGTLAGTRTKNAASGVASFGDLTISRPGTGYTLTAMAPGLAGATSASFTITATTGTIAGRVTRASDGGALSGVALGALQVGLVKGSATTGVDGTYSMAGLAPGSYDVRASASGYQAQTQSGITVSAGSATTVNFSLTPIPGVAIRITAPATGSVLNEPAALVRGDVSGVGSTGVTLTMSMSIQGQPIVLPVPVEVNGGRFAALVGLTPGSIGLVAQATDSTGQSAQDSVTVSFQPDPPEYTQAVPPDVSPTFGFAPLTVTFGGTEAANPDVTGLDLDVDGDGQPDFTLTSFVPPNYQVTYTYQTEGLYVAAMVVRDQTGQSRRTLVPINVLPAPDLAPIWDAFRDALGRGDVDGAAGFVALEVRERYRQAFSDLLADLASIAAGLGAITPHVVTAEYATASVTRVRDGVSEGFLVHFVRDGDGVWRIASM